MLRPPDPTCNPSLPSHPQPLLISPVPRPHPSSWDPEFSSPLVRSSCVYPRTPQMHPVLISPTLPRCCCPKNTPFQPAQQPRLAPVVQGTQRELLSSSNRTHSTGHLPSLPLDKRSRLDHPRSFPIPSSVYGSLGPPAVVLFSLRFLETGGGVLRSCSTLRTVGTDLKDLEAPGAGDRRVPPPPGRVGVGKRERD